MLITGVAYPEQLAALTKALQDYCREAGIEPGTSAYETAAARAMALARNGVSTVQELVDALRMSQSGSCDPNLAGGPTRPSERGRPAPRAKF